MNNPNIDELNIVEQPVEEARGEELGRASPDLARRDPEELDSPRNGEEQRSEESSDQEGEQAEELDQEEVPPRSPRTPEELEPEDEDQTNGYRDITLESLQVRLRVLEADIRRLSRWRPHLRRRLERQEERVQAHLDDEDRIPELE